MLSYEICKKLSDSGFPPSKKKPINVWFKYAGDKLKGEYWKNIWLNNPKKGLQNNEWYRCPTLSELIESLYFTAAGCQFSLYGRDENRWEATLFPVLKPLPAHCPERTIGETPEEAVAFLWLALNPKKE